MRIDEYTPEAICRAMGIESFVDALPSTAEGAAIRFLLQPSFHPEVCVTLTSDTNETAHAEVRAFLRQFWSMPTPAHRPGIALERVSIAKAELDATAARVEDVAEALSRDGKRWIVIADGMPVHAICRANRRVATVSANCSESAALMTLIADVANLLYFRMPAGICRNALAHAAGYSDQRLPTEDIPERTVSTVILLGDDNGKREVADRLARDRSKRSE